jgi:lambda repressor-like predicted transcriptional regulator
MTDWNAVRADYEKGGSLKDLAQKYGVKANTIKGRRQREKWKRLEHVVKQDSITKRFSIWEEGYNPNELLAREDIEEGFTEKMLKKMYYANISIVINGSTTIEEIYNEKNELVRRKIIRKPPTPANISNLILLNEQIALLSINMNEIETEEEREARYLEYYKGVQKQREYYENRDINKELEELDKKK